MTPTIAEIAAGLSEAQRRILLGDGSMSDAVHIDMDGRRLKAASRLHDAGLISQPRVEKFGAAMSEYTELGLAVRDFLREKEAGRG